MIRIQLIKNPSWLYLSQGFCILQWPWHVLKKFLKVIQADSITAVLINRDIEGEYLEYYRVYSAWIDKNLRIGFSSRKSIIKGVNIVVVDEMFTGIKD